MRRTTFQTTMLSGAAVAAILLPLSAQAQTQDELLAEINAMKAQIAALEQKLNAQASTPAPAEEAPAISYGGTGLKFTSPDGRNSIQFGGRVQAEAALYDEDKSYLGDGTELRRTRIFTQGKVFDDWGFKFELDVATGNASVNDAYIAYLGLDSVTIRVGHEKPPFSLDQFGSAKYITFIERATPVALALGRLTGIDASYGGSNFSAMTGLYGESFNDDAGSEGDEGWHAVGRVTYAPIAEKTMAVHLGLSAGYEDPRGSTVRFRERPESHVTGARFVDTGNLAGVDSVTRIAAELAAVWGPLSLQGEYLTATVSRSPRSALPGLDDVTFDGWYAQASYFLTGESRNYDASSGTFGRISPNQAFGDGGWGAWEVAGRYSTIDLSDGSVRGGNESNWSLGLNWYATKNVRFSFNYVNVDNDSEATGNAANLKSGIATAGNDDPQIYQISAYIDF
ncbi:MAG: porin [Rhodospirillaceae bacterium]|nr:porin [Rhodospirillaceae bacterium]